MSLIELHTDPTTRQLRQFAGLTLPLFAVIVGTILWWRFDQTVAPGVIGGLALVFAVIGTLRPAVARPVYLGWMYAAYPIGWLIGHLLLGVVFFLILTPIGLLMRMVGRDPLSRRFDDTRTSYWDTRDERPEPSRYFRQY
jgi:hypothetical protein